MSEYPIWLVIAALAILGAVVLPRILEDPVANAAVTERLTELVIVISLMGAALDLDRPFDPVRWSATGGRHAGRAGGAERGMEGGLSPAAP